MNTFLLNFQVGKIQETLESLKPNLLQAEKEASILVDQLEEETQMSKQQLLQIQKEEEEAKLQNTEALHISIQMESEMALVKQELDKSLQHITQLKKEHLVEIKSLGQPPKGVVLTMAALVILCQNYIKSNGGEIIYFQQNQQQ